MKRLFLLTALMATLLLMFGCGHKKQVEEVKPAVTEPAPTPTPEPKPEPKSEPVIKKVSESDFQAVYFDFDKYNLIDAAKQALDMNAQLLKDNPSVMVRIEGNCDERGTVEYNLSLGEKRAASAKKYLIDLGIDASRLQTISYGKERPIDMGHNEASWAKNRRDDFKIISQ
jgi:peptidoglycan-associated lipoprotein